MREKLQLFSFKFGNFWGKLGKKEDILDWERGRISDPGDREKMPCIAIWGFAIKHLQL